MLSRPFVAIGCIALLLGAIPAGAQLPDPDADAIAATVLRLSARAEKFVPRDRLLAELRIDAIARWRKVAGRGQ